MPNQASCNLKIERAGIQILGNIGVTQYTLNVNCTDAAGIEKIQSSRIIHRWIKEGDNRRLLGGMRYDK